MSTPASISTVSEEDASAVRRLHAAWIWGWDKDRDQGPWQFREIQGRFYDWDFDGGRYYDDMDPEHRVFRNVRDYAQAWEPAFEGMLEAMHRIQEGPEVFGAANLVSSRLVFIARLVMADGSVVDIRTHNSLVWHRFSDGWKIVGDHTSSQPVPSAEVDRLLDELPGATTFH